jgi:hypothetical protein
MKWFKSKATKLAEKEQARTAVLDGIQKQIDDANKCPDVAERFLKLEEIRQAIDTLTGQTAADANTTAKSKFHLAYMGVGTGATAAITAAAITLHFPPAIFFFLAFPGIMAGSWAGQKRVVQAQMRLAEENKPFFDALAAKGAVVAAQTDAILKDDLKTLAASDRFSEIVQKAPRVRDHFTAAFARELAKKDNPKDSPKPHSGGGFRL